MKSRIIAIAAAIAAAGASHALSAELTVKFGTHGENGNLASENASCVAASGKAAAGANKSPALSWSAGPSGTRAYALAMTDPDVPADLSLLNQPGTKIRRDQPRMEFTHWILAEIPADVTQLAEGADGDGLPKGGLPLEATAHGRRGQNGFASFFKDGAYGGYMGPCPPWNDLLAHRYRVTVYALDTDRLDLPAAFTRADFLTAASGHVLASGAAELTYAINGKATK